MKQIKLTDSELLQAKMKILEAYYPRSLALDYATGKFQSCLPTPRKALDELDALNAKGV